MGDMRADHWRIEAHYVPESLDDALELADKLVEVGVRPTVAYSVALWAAQKAERGTDPTSAPTRSAYRRALQQLWDSGYRPPRRLRVIPGLRKLPMLAVA